MCKLSPQARKEFRQMFSIVFGCSQSIRIVGKQIHSEGTVTGSCQTKAHPTVSCAEIQNPSTSLWEVRLQHTCHQTVVAARPDLPLFAIPSGYIRVGESKIERFTFATTAFRRPYSFILFYKTRIVRGSLRRQRVYDAATVLEMESTGETVKPTYGASATRALQTHPQMRSISGNLM
jgi:hypothetical protein